MSGLLLLTATWAQAQQPDAGSALRDLQVPSLTVPFQGARPILTLPDDAPRATLPTDISLTVQRFRVSGNTVIDSETLEALLADLLATEMSLSQLYAATDRITDAYQARGYILSRAYLPAQEISPDQGEVNITVLEGSFGEITLENSSLVRDSRILKQLETFTPGAIIKAEPLEEQLLLIDDLPGIAVQTRMGAGSVPGTADLVVIGAEQPRFNGSVGIDNQGNSSTGQHRLRLSTSLVSPLGVGDNFNLNALYSDEDQLFYQANYTAPLGDSALGLGLSASRMSYELAGDFVDLQASGTADTLGMSLQLSLLRSRSMNVRSELALEQRDLEDSISDGALITTKQAQNVSLNLSGDWRDNFAAGAISTFSVRLVHGDITLQDGTFPPETPSGRFNKIMLSGLRLQNVSERFSLYTAFQGQIADSNLDSSEKFMFGGAQGVRAYPLGEGSGDEGAMINMELRYRLGDSWQVKALIDAAYSTVVKKPFADDDNNRLLSGVGLGLDWQSALGLRMSIVAASPTGEAVRSGENKDVRVWASLQWLM